MRELTLQWHVEGRPVTYIVAENRPIVIGRRADCDIILAPRTISRQHATIFAYRGLFYLRNLSQHNPIYVNGQQLGGDRQLQSGDLVQLSDVPLYVLAINEPAWNPPPMRVRCAACQHVVEGNLRDCPWCGASLAHGVTVYM